jgi:glycosyltransferase involved in cell wall biosynthesis
MGALVIDENVELAPRAMQSALAPPARVLLWHWGRAGAGATFTIELARAMRDHPRMEIEVSASQGSELHELMQTLGVPTNVVPTFNGDKSSGRGRASAAFGVLRLPSIGRNFGKLLAERRIDVALCTMQTIWDIATLPGSSRRDTRTVMVLHDAFIHPGDIAFFHPDDGYRLLRSAVLRRQILAADALIVLSDHVRQQAIEFYGYPAERIWQMPHGAFNFGDGEVIPATHPRSARPLRLLFFGRILQYKGLGHLLRAQRMLRERGVEVDLVVAGSGSLEDVAGLLDGLSGVEVHNHWLSNQEVASFMAEADAVVLPYIEASQSGVAATAFAAGRPVVATPVGGLVQQVSHDRTGLLAKDMTVEALADAIQTFASDANLFDLCAAGAFAHALNDLSWQKSAEVVAEVVTEVRKMPRRSRARA